MTSDPVAVVERARAAIAATTAPTSMNAWPRARARLLDDRTRVLVVGEFKQGKSIWSTAWRRAGLPDRSTTSPPRCPPSCGTPRPSSPPLLRPDARAASITARRARRPRLRAGQPGNREGWSHAEVGLPRAILSGGLEIVDTPGVGGLASVHGAATTAMLPSPTRCCSSPTPPRSYTAPELEFLAPGHGGLPERGLRRHQDRPVPGVAAHRRAEPGPPADGGHPTRDLRRVVALRWHAVLRRRRRRSTPSPASRAGRLPAQDACSAQARPAGPARRGARRAGRHRADRGQPGRRADGPAGPGRRGRRRCGS